MTSKAFRIKVPKIRISSGDAVSEAGTTMKSVRENC